ncbi:NRAMP family divalent metal transporter [Pendulispora albinea]|uniref:Divalent metal cation transporter n=1 Tax=Pendulispora albinea TaxID=2741071 RepID=A0ABZ2LUN7_9BACT
MTTNVERHQSAVGRRQSAQPEKPGSTGTSTAPKKPKKKVWRSIGLGLITGAADDDPSAIGTYASAGAKLGPSFLWTAPVTFPMMFAVVYLSSKLGQVTGKGLFAVIRDHYPRWILHTALIGVLIGNTIEAGADIGGMAAAVELLVPVPRPIIVVVVSAAILCLQIWGSYQLIRNVFRWLALSLLAYVGAAFLAKPDLGEVVRGTLVPSIRFDREFLSLLVAVIGTTLSAYLYTWQSNEEVEEKIAEGRTRLSERRGTSDERLAQSKWDILLGMFFSNLVMYFIILATGSTLYRAGVTDIDSAAEAARALRPIAGGAAEWLFAAGIIGVGVLAVPVMTTGAAYDLCQVLGWKHGLGMKPHEARRFYGAITFFTLVGMAMNFLGINPLRALVLSGIVQGFSTPPLLLLIMLMTNNRAIMGHRVNGKALNVLGWTTVVAIFSATAGLVYTWIL